MPIKRDPKTGQFMANAPTKKAKKKTAKKKPKKKGAQKRSPISGKFGKKQDVYHWPTNPLNREVVLVKWESVRPILRRQSEDSSWAEFPVLTEDQLLDVFVQLSSNKVHVIVVVFLHMPHYATDDDAAAVNPRRCVYIGRGMQLISEITTWLREGYVISTLSAHQTSANAFLPAKAKFHWHPIWGDDYVDTVDGQIPGSGDRQSVPERIDGRHKRRKRMNDDHRHAPSPATKARKKAARKAYRENLKKQGIKRNKGNTTEQKRRQRERKKAQKKEIK